MREMACEKVQYHHEGRQEDPPNTECKKVARKVCAPSNCQIFPVRKFATTRNEL
ncbi:Uncharacterized protein FKW44_020097 [Caligus rogercresseyi]|uniref:Uncharacterized protein n=1 Tax=Caligus rogercresseyi TaxID=217165 RepID=A0A7T8GXI4_CALRO|nr:Uncharacterized protein FKW44_020097 [Caligus rogercresseyi]